jgi:uncharacterized protein YndB with AHSA1/START domain
MSAEVRTEPIVQERQLNASPETVFAFFTDPEKATRWLAAEVTFDPRPGGVNLQTHIDREGKHHHMRGKFLEVSPPSRVVFSWSFEEGGDDASTVEVTLEPRDGGTWLRLVHSDLPEPARADHEQGWNTLLDLLVTEVDAS